MIKRFIAFLTRRFRKPEVELPERCSANEISSMLEEYTGWLARPEIGIIPLRDYMMGLVDGKELADRFLIISHRK